MFRHLLPLSLFLLLVGCSGGKVSRYHEGDLNTRSFGSHISSGKKPQGEHYVVKRNKKGQIVSAKHLNTKKHLIEKSTYKYTRKGQLKSHRLTKYFYQGPPRVTKEWIYVRDRITQKEEKWFTRNRSLEKRLTIHFDSEQKPYLEETWGLGRKIESSTEYYYDYKHHLDKSRRNFFDPDGRLRDYWLTIYNDESQIINEEHYFADNSLIAFYRYSYHPVHAFREHEEVLEESHDRFISRTFDEYGLILVEKVHLRDLTLMSRKVFEYNDKHKPTRILHYNGQGTLVKTSKYTNPRYQQSFRTPGI